MLGDGEQQVAKPAERVGTDRLLFVIADPHAVQPLSGEDVEVVEPKVDHYLLELASAQHRFQNARRRSFAHDECRPRLLRVDVLRCRLDAHNRAQRPIELAQRDRIEPEGIKLGQAKAQRDRLRDRCGIELFGDVALDPDHLDVIEIVEGRAKGEPI